MTDALSAHMYFDLSVSFYKVAGVDSVPRHMVPYQRHLRRLPLPLL